MIKETELLKLIEVAARAPSGHNTQPWLFYMNDSEIQIHPDFSRALPVVDADNHALYISLGCAAENIAVAAKSLGYNCVINLSETKAGVHFISIKLLPGNSIHTGELSAYIHLRQTNRGPYRSEEIKAKDLEELRNVSLPDNVSIKYFISSGEIKTLEPFIIEASNLQFQNKNFVRELVLWFRFSEKEAKEKADGLWTACLGLPKMNSFIGNMVMKYFVSPGSEAKRWKKLIHATSGFAMFIARENTIENWIELGRSFQRFALTATKLNISHAHVNMPCEELSIRNKMMNRFGLDPFHPLLLIRFGYADKMPYSYRRNTKEVVTNIPPTR